ncbi:Hexapeptide repeat of succinyl-transferase [Chryseobacterium wanjuense]|uniref:Hexapeptide repeat of succinyl-transferase n=1 Tax=Chryseobacterium wanjuense TaxID=356305 RepID=A0A1I0RJ64_9FLAO|nr:acyltransferase [Chryseobacterium wanjuense]SEW41008.1 Hexapeptide repeat of succinyl-transferase [Chryseobacterium wanjuense]
MLLLYRAILKIHTTYQFMIQKIYLKICLAKGLKVGKNVRFVEVPQFGTECFLIEIGDQTTFSNNVRFVNHDGGQNALHFFDKYKDVRTFGRIKIGKQCLIGADTIIMLGVEMGDNCVLGAGSILTTSMPSGTVYAGVPAKYICTIEEYGDKLLANNVMYPRELEKDRPKLEAYIKEHLPHTYKPVKK